MKRGDKAIKGLDDFLLVMIEEASKELKRKNIDRMDVARALYGVSTGIFVSSLTLNPDYVSPIFAAFSISRSIDEDSRPVNEEVNELKKIGLCNTLGSRCNRHIGIIKLDVTLPKF